MLVLICLWHVSIFFIDIYIVNIYSTISNVFYGDDDIDDVTGWPQIRPAIFLNKWNKNIFHDD